MASHLYAAQFSNGLIKVGRSGNPAARIAGHVDRVAATGLTCEARHIAACVGNSHAAESRLIARCAQEATVKHLKEWFVGLDFERVCEWLDAEAAALEPPRTERYQFRPVIDGPAAAAATYFFCRACSRAEAFPGRNSSFICNDCFDCGFRFGIGKDALTGLNKHGSPVPLWIASDGCRMAFQGVSCEELRPDVAWVRLADKEHALGRPVTDPAPRPDVAWDVLREQAPFPTVASASAAEAIGGTAEATPPGKLAKLAHEAG
jgi:hypothetical protein